MRYPLVLSALSVVCLLPAWALTVEQEAKLLPTDGAAGDTFGFAVAVDGDAAVIDATRDDDNGENSGSAYVFRLYDDDVPATTYRGMAVMTLLLLIASTALLLRRRAAH